MAKQGKVWGETEEIFNNGIVSVNHLKIKAGGYCSEHKHLKKSNQFFVLSGRLAVIIWNDEINGDETIIKPRESTTVPPGVFHKFWAVTNVECLEIYEVRFEDEDIERRTTGGME